MSNLFDIPPDDDVLSSPDPERLKSLFRGDNYVELPERNQEPILPALLPYSPNIGRRFGVPPMARTKTWRERASTFTLPLRWQIVMAFVSMVLTLVSFGLLFAIIARNHAHGSLDKVTMSIKSLGFSQSSSSSKSDDSTNMFLSGELVFSGLKQDVSISKAVLFLVINNTQTASIPLPSATLYHSSASLTFPLTTLTVLDQGSFALLVNNTVSSSKFVLELSMTATAKVTLVKVPGTSEAATKKNSRVELVGLGAYFSSTPKTTNGTNATILAASFSQSRPDLLSLSGTLCLPNPSSIRFSPLVSNAKLALALEPGGEPFALSSIGSFSLPIISSNQSDSSCEGVYANGASVLAINTFFTLSNASTASYVVQQFTTASACNMFLSFLSSDSTSDSWPFSAPALALIIPVIVISSPTTTLIGDSFLDPLIPSSLFFTVPTSTSSPPQPIVTTQFSAVFPVTNVFGANAPIVFDKFRLVDGILTTAAGDVGLLTTPWVTVNQQVTASSAINVSFAMSQLLVTSLFPKFHHELFSQKSFTFAIYGGTIDFDVLTTATAPPTRLSMVGVPNYQDIQTFNGMQGAVFSPTTSVLLANTTLSFNTTMTNPSDHTGTTLGPLVLDMLDAGQSIGCSVSWRSNTALAPTTTSATLELNGSLVTPLSSSQQTTLARVISDLMAGSRSLTLSGTATSPLDPTNNFTQHVETVITVNALSPSSYLANITVNRMEVIFVTNASTDLLLDLSVQFTFPSNFVGDVVVSSIADLTVFVTPPFDEKNKSNSDPAFSLSQTISPIASPSGAFSLSARATSLSAPLFATLMRNVFDLEATSAIVSGQATPTLQFASSLGALTLPKQTFSAFSVKLPGLHSGSLFINGTSFNIVSSSATYLRAQFSGSFESTSPNTIMRFGDVPLVAYSGVAYAGITYLSSLNITPGIVQITNAVMELRPSVFFLVTEMLAGRPITFDMLGDDTSTDQASRPAASLAIDAIDWTLAVPTKPQYTFVDALAIDLPTGFLPCGVTGDCTCLTQIRLNNPFAVPIKIVDATQAIYSCSVIAPDGKTCSNWNSSIEVYAGNFTNEIVEIPVGAQNRTWSLYYDVVVPRSNFFTLSKSLNSPQPILARITGTFTLQIGSFNIPVSYSERNIPFCLNLDADQCSAEVDWRPPTNTNADCSFDDEKKKVCKHTRYCQFDAATQNCVLRSE
eukprot:c13011_g1_i4.p1 GENE.c13011_g1_i4~~c13011_g1_i4.p1  ORF type:complete len:1195 (-),score=287.65 c13011_g1_i4:209-3793(-)